VKQHSWIDRSLSFVAFIWLPIQTVKVPVSNRFGNVQPSVMAHRILWNIDRVFLKRRDS
jgi:hypothetical protein